MLRALLLVFILVITPRSLAPAFIVPIKNNVYEQQAADRICESVALYREARGESHIGQRSVLDVIRNRSSLLWKSSCAVLSMPGQFAFYRKGMKWQATPKMLSQLDKIAAMESVVPSDVVFFRTKSAKWGRFYKRIGAHYFSRIAVKDRRIRIASLK